MRDQICRMQGVRSTISCTCCKARKKGCDFRKPTCTRCERLNLSCQYEPRRYAFVEVSGKTGSTPNTFATSSPRGSMMVPTITSNTSLLATDFSLQASEGFWLVYLPIEDEGQDGSFGGLLSAPWVPVIRGIAQANPSVRQALEACVYAGLGWVNDDYSLVHHGARPYMSALRQVNKALQDPHQATNDTVLAACRILSLFEMLRKLPASGGEEVPITGWATHAAGAYQLLRLRGRERHVSGQGFHLYDGVRIMGIMQGLGQRRPNMFTKMHWNLPQRDLRDELFDLMSSVPELFEASDRLLAECSKLTIDDPQDLTQQGNILLEHYFAIGHALLTWEKKALALCEASSSSPKTMSVDSSHNLLDQSRSHGYAFFYVCTQYWASCLTTYTSYRALHLCLDNLQSQGEISIALLPLPAFMDPEPHMHNIVSTCSHFFGPRAGLWSAQAAVFPFSVALIYLLRTGRRNSPPFNTITNTLANNKAGSVMSEFIHNITLAKV